MVQPREEWSFDTRLIGRQVLVFDEVGSTNSLAAELARPERNGLVILAENQSAGRGRFGRRWHSRPGSSLLASVVLFPPPQLRRAPVLTAWAAVGTAQMIEELTGLRPRIKWPNDLLIGGKKVCGILIDQAEGVVTGIGLNLNQTAAEFETFGLPGATSLMAASDEVVGLRDAVGVFVWRLDALYGELLTGAGKEIEREWGRRTELLDEVVLVEQVGGGLIEGKMRRMGFDHLEVETSCGMVQKIVPEMVVHISTLRT